MRVRARRCCLAASWRDKSESKRKFVTFWKW